MSESPVRPAKGHFQASWPWSRPHGRKGAHGPRPLLASSPPTRRPCIAALLTLSTTLFVFYCLLPSVCFIEASGEGARAGRTLRPAVRARPGRRSPPRKQPHLTGSRKLHSLSEDSAYPPPTALTPMTLVPVALPGVAAPAETERPASTSLCGHRKGRERPQPGPWTGQSVDRNAPTLVICVLCTVASSALSDVWEGGVVGEGGGPTPLGPSAPESPPL